MFEWLFGKSICDTKDSISKLNALSLRGKITSPRGEVRIIDTCINPSKNVFTSTVKYVKDCNKYILTCNNLISSVIASPKTLTWESLKLIKDCSHGTEVAGVIAAKQEVTTSTKFINLDLEFRFGPDYSIDEPTINICGLAPTLDNIRQLPDLITKDGKNITKDLFEKFVFKRISIQDSKGNIVIEDFSEPLLLASHSGTFTSVDFWDIAKNYCNDNILFVTAAGNSNKDFNTLSINDIKKENSACLPPPPQCADITICVGTYIYEQDQRVIQGNYGNKYIDIVADTTKIFTVMPYDGYSGFQFGSTSFAAPQITAAIAFMKSCAPEASAQKIKQALLKYSDTDNTIDNKVIAGKVFDLTNTVENFCNSPDL